MPRESARIGGIATQGDRFFETRDDRDDIQNVSVAHLSCQAGTIQLDFHGFATGPVHTSLQSSARVRRQRREIPRRLQGISDRFVGEKLIDRRSANAAYHCDLRAD
jgi:hypothetical protein